MGKDWDNPLFFKNIHGKCLGKGRCELTKNGIALTFLFEPDQFCFSVLDDDVGRKSIFLRNGR